MQQLELTPADQDTTFETVAKQWLATLPPHAYRYVRVHDDTLRQQPRTMHALLDHLSRSNARRAFVLDLEYAHVDYAVVCAAVASRGTLMVSLRGARVYDGAAAERAMSPVAMLSRLCADVGEHHYMRRVVFADQREYDTSLGPVSRWTHQHYDLLTTCQCYYPRFLRANNAQRAAAIR